MKFTIKIKILLLLLFLPLLMLSQNTFNISGRILDEEDKSALMGTNLALKKRKGNELLKGSVADLNGYFTLQNVTSGNYKLIVSFVGYITDTIIVQVKDKDINLGTVYLKQDAALLKEVEVKAVQTRIEIKGDTIEHKADAYKTHPDATAEDLVKKLPGVTVEGNTVKVEGEEVKKVLVDGKPYFSDDPTATLRNLPADIIDNIQMFDFMSEQSQFTGFRDGNEEKTINLNTKRGMNVGRFGKAYAGYGPDNKYNAGLTLNSFNSSQRISLIAMSNNINQQNFNTSDIMSVMSNASDQGGGRQSRGRGRGGASDFMTGQQSGVTNTDAVGINYNDIWGTKVKVSASYFFNQTDNNDSSSVSRTYFTQDNLTYNEHNSSHTKNLNHKFNAKVEYLLDSMNKLTITPRITIQEYNKNSMLGGVNNYPINNEMISETQNNTADRNKGINFNNDLLFQHKFKKKGRTISLNINTQLNNRDGSGNHYSTSMYDDTLVVNEIIDRTYSSESRNVTLGGNLSYTEPLKKNMRLMITYRPTYRINDADRMTNAKDSSGIYTLTDTLLSNIFNNFYLSHRGGVSYGLNTAKATLTLGADAEKAFLRGKQTFPAEYSVDKVFNTVLPSAYFNYKFSKTFSLITNFRSSTRVPEISQLQNIVDISNPLFAKSGNPDLEQSFENRLTLRLMKRLPEKEQHFMLFVSARQTNDYISNATYFMNKDTLVQNVLINKGSQFSKPVNLDEYYNVRTYGVFGFPLNKLKSNLNFNAGYTFSQTPAIINGNFNYSKNNALNAGFFLSSNISKNLDFSLSYNGSYNNVDNTLQTQSDNAYFNHTTAFKINAIVLKNWVINSDISQIQYTGLSESYNQNFTLWNAYLGYKIQKKQSFELKLSANDILNQNTSISRNITETYTEDVRTQVLNRYLLLTLSYTFKYFKNGAQEPDEIKPPKGMRPQGNMPRPPHE